MVIFNKRHIKINQNPGPDPKFRVCYLKNMRNLRIETYIYLLELTRAIPVGDMVGE